MSIIYYSKSIVPTVTGMFLKEYLVSRVPSANRLKKQDHTIWHQSKEMFLLGLVEDTTIFCSY